MSEVILRQEVETLYQHAADSRQEFCIDLEGEAPDGRLVWEWMDYARKDNAVRALNNLIEGEDFLLRRSAEQTTGSGGHNRATAVFSRTGFKRFGMLARTERGRQIRDYYIECENRLQLGMSQPTAMNGVMDEIKVAHAELAAIVATFGTGVKHELTDIRLDVGELKTGQQQLISDVAELKKSRHKRRAPSKKHQALYLETVEKGYGGACPCCRQHKPHMEFDHWYDRSQAGLDEVWLICTDCNRKLGAGGDQGRKAYERQFHGFQDRLTDFANGFQTELDLPAQAG